MNRLLLFTLLSVGLNSWTQQTTADSISVNGIVRTAKEDLPLPFAKIHDQEAKIGTVTNGEGHFYLDHLSQNDTLIFSYVGYEKVVIPLKDFPLNGIITLKEKDNLLSKVDVYSTDPYLYELIELCKKNKAGRLSSKTYLLVESFCNKEQVEALEAYYNGAYQGYTIESLNLKAGRIGIAPVNNHFLTSTETSKAILKFSLFEETSLFPNNPFNTKKRKLVKEYKLYLSKKYLSEEGNTIFQIKYAPRKEDADLFKGTVWIDSNRTELVRIEMEINNTTQHPFAPTGNAAEILNMSMKINKNFGRYDDQVFVSSVDFDYAYLLKSSSDQYFNIHTSAFLSAFAPDEAYDLPYFDFPDAMYLDYTSISVFPENDFFWNNNYNFQLRKESERVKAFIDNRAKLNNLNLYGPNAYKDNGFLDCDYVPWSLSRVIIKPRRSSEEIKPGVVKTSVESSKYNIEVQLFLDITETKDSIHVVTATIMDPFNSYFLFEINNVSIAFINMSIDLVEMYRRELHEKLIQQKTKEDMIEVFETALIELEKMKAEFRKDVQHGTSKQGMIKWNERIQQSLGVDNLDVFHVQFKE